MNGWQIAGFALLVIGAVVAFGSSIWARKLFKVENPKQSLTGLMIKVVGLVIAVGGFFMTMAI